MPIVFIFYHYHSIVTTIKNALTIENKKVVGIVYQLTDNQQQVLDDGDDPIEYLHGYGNILPELEKSLTGLRIGDKKKVILTAKEAYGDYNPSLIQSFPHTAFEDLADLEVGAELEVSDPKGSTYAIVKDITNETVVLDGNHPLAGKVLHFELEVTSIRDATAEEVTHGHVHSGDWHHHHH